MKNNNFKLPDSPLAALDIDVPVVEQLWIHEIVRKVQYDDTASVLNALDQLLAITTYELEQGGTHPDDSVAVPMWILNAISGRYNNYVSAHIEGRKPTLGEAFLIEGGKQGKHRSIDSHLREVRDRSICLTIALEKRKHPKKSLNKIFSKLATDGSRDADATVSGMTNERIKQIWYKNRKKAEPAIKLALARFKDQLL
jgi:hypothetical protein